MITTDGGINTSTGAFWRLVYSGKKVLCVIEGREDSQTSSVHNIKELGSEAEVAECIMNMGLDTSVMDG